MKYRAEIDGLRAVAVMSVLLFHLKVPAFGGGFVGVDVFFVISGYLITRIISEEVTQTGSFSFRGFYLRRLRRLFPALLATVSASIPFAYWLLSPLNFKEFGGSAVMALTSTSNFYFWSLVDYFNTANITKPLLHTWSLSVEEQFYLAWPALITFVTVRKWSVPIVLAVLGSLSLLANIPLTYGHVPTIFYLTPFRVFEFVLGAIVLWLPRFDRPSLGSLLTISGLVLISFSVFTYTEATIFPSIEALIPCVGAALVIYGGANLVADVLLGNPASVFVGKISYSLYLVHWPLIVFYRYYIFDPPTAFEQVCLVVVSVAGACMLHFAIERPFHKRQINIPSRVFVVSCAGAAVALAIPSAAIWSSHGWLWRFPAPVAEQLAFKVNTFHKYVWKELDRRATPFADDGKPKLLIIGDSQAGDLVNLLVSAGVADKTDMRSIPIRHDCKPIIPSDVSIYRATAPAFADQCEKQLATVKADPRLREANTIVLAASWTDWAVDRIPETITYLNRFGHKAIFVLGSKLQTITGVQFLATYGIRPHSAAFKDTPSDGTIEANTRIQNLKSDFRFLNPLDLFCSTDGCSIVSDSGYLIIYDNLHLTPKGVEYLAPRLAARWGAELTASPTFSQIEHN